MVGQRAQRSSSILLDPFKGVGGSNFELNLVDIRLELNVLFHVRSIDAVYVAEIGS